MKATSVGLEIEITLSEDEIFRLNYQKLETLLKFNWPDFSKKRDIPLSLEYVPGVESLEVSQIPPNGYFGEAKQIRVLLPDYQYTQLLSTGSCGDRFYGATGKILITRGK